MAESQKEAHVKIGSYEFQLDESVDGIYQTHYLYEETQSPVSQGVLGDTGKVDEDADERLLWRMSDWSGGEGARYWNPADPTVYDYSEESSNTYVTQGDGANVRIAGQVTGRPNRARHTKTVTDAKKQPFLTHADGNAWVLCSKEIFINDFDTGSSDAWTAVTTNNTSGHSITAAGATQDWAIWCTADSDSSALMAANAGKSGAAVISDSASAFGTGGVPLRNKLVFYNGRMYGWTGRKLWEIDIFDALSGSGASGSVSTLTKNGNPGYRKVYDTGTNEMVDGHYGGNSNDSWFCDMVSSETAVYFMTAMRGMSYVYEFKAGVGKPIWNLPIGFTAKSLTINNGVLFAWGQWGGEASTTHKGGAGYAMPLATRQPVLLSWVRQHQEQSLHMQEAAVSFGSTIMVAACNTGRVFIYDMDTDGLSMFDKLPYDYSASTAGSVVDGTHSSNAGKIGALLTYGEYRMAAVSFPRSSDACTTIELYVWDKDTPADREVSNSNHSAVSKLFMPRFDFNLSYETKMLYGFHVSYQVEDDSTTSGLKAGQSIEIAYALDNGTFSTTVASGASATITSSTTPTSGVKGRTFIQVSDGTTTQKFFSLRYRMTLTGARTGGTNYAPPIVMDVTCEARSLDTDKSWTLALRMKDDIDNQRLPNDRRYASDARSYLRTIMTNKNVVTLLDYYRYQTNHGATPRQYSSHTVIVTRIRDRIHRNGEGYCEVELKAVKT